MGFADAAEGILTRLVVRAIQVQAGGDPGTRYGAGTAYRWRRLNKLWLS